MPSAVKGTLVECDPSIKALIVMLDSMSHDIILEELDDTHLFVDPHKVGYIREELNKRLNKTLYGTEEEEE